MAIMGARSDAMEQLLEWRGGVRIPRILLAWLLPLCLLGLLVSPSPVRADHALGTREDVAPFSVGPGGGVVAFTDPGAKFLLLRVTASAGSTGDRLRVTLPYGDDVLDLVAGQQVWTRPAPGSSVNLEYLDNGDGMGGAVITRIGRGTIIDLFQLNPFVDPAFNTGGLCGGPVPDWQDVDCLNPANSNQNLMKTVGASVGMFVMIHGAEVSSCSAALIDSDLILTAAHCVPTDVEVASGSFTLDYKLDCGGATPAGYNPRFYKMVGPPLVRSGWQDPPDSNLDYAVVQIDTSPGLSAPPLQMRPDRPPTGEEVFAIHHPRGAPKKVSRKPLDPQCEVLPNSDLDVVDFACDIDNGSSGSPLLDLSGRIVGVNDWRLGACVRAQATRVIRPDLISPVPPAVDVDTMVVFDRSGSMGMTAPGGNTKLQDAKEAAGLFYDLLRTTASHQAGLVSFSNTLSTNHDLAPITDGDKDSLLGVPHGTGGTVGLINAGGLTAIGDGLERAQQRLNVLGGVNTPTMLLMTDGLQNTGDSIESVEPGLGATRICAVGFGSEASLDGPLLTRLARDHGGLYTRADRGLDLKKFFALCFGNIFENGISMDPTYHLDEGQTVSEEIPIPVCGETSLTAVVAWENPKSDLFLRLKSPGGAVFTASTPGITDSTGPTWAYLRLPLPFNGERDGIWSLTANRSAGSNEFPRFDHEDFVALSVIDGGPKLEPVPLPTLYTGDLLTPLVTLRDAKGRIYHADVTAALTRPTKGTGNLLTASGLGPAVAIDGDQLDARTSTLLSLEKESAGPLIPTTTLPLTLLDDGENDEGAFEEDGQFGARLQDVLTREGHYSFHAVAEYGEECSARRENFWSAYVSVGIDPDATDTEVRPGETLPDGRTRVTVVFTPRDRYGNFVGPGRGGSFGVDPRPGSDPLGDPMDLGDGSYEVDVAWDPDSGEPPGFGVSQPDRPAVDLTTDPPAMPVTPDRGRAFGLAYGSAIPVGNSNFSLDPGFGALISYRHRVAPRTSFVAGLGYAGFDGDGAPDLGLFDLTWAGRFDTRPDPATRFFVKGGVGYYAPETDIGGGSAGIHVGVGIDVPIRGPAANPPLEFEMSLEGHHLFDSKRDPNFLRALVGLVVRH